ncbi:hypothetical protein H9P43_004571 [Blastocladiella emersonii ATCC 22665]|nr:hypothetical protein H9P43_004571 [Blastocladiella emersonii ATCC 22665]
MAGKALAAAKKAKAKARSASAAAAKSSSSPSPASVPAIAAPLAQLVAAVTTNLALLASESATPSLALAEPDFDATFYATQLTAVGKHLHHGITKLALVHKESASVSLSASRTEVKNLVTLTTQLAAHVATRPPALGATVRKAHFATAEEILRAVRALARGFLHDVAAAAAAAAAESGAEDPVGEYLLNTGVAWKAADLLAAAPRTNADAVRASWTKHVALVRDVAAEIKESVDEFAEGTHGGDWGSDFEADSETEAEPASESDLAPLRTVHKLASLAASLAAKLPLDAIPNAADLDQLPGLTDVLEAALDELGAACAEPPIDTRAARGFLNTVCATWTRILGMVAEDNAWAGEAKGALERAGKVVAAEFPEDE